MPCPICDESGFNCDCTRTEIEQFRELEDQDDRIRRLEIFVETYDAEISKAGIWHIGCACHNVFTKLAEARRNL